MSDRASVDVRSPRGFKSPFSVFGDQVHCPHCGHHYPRTDLKVVRRLPDGRLAVTCPKCGAHGLLSAEAGMEEAAA